MDRKALLAELCGTFALILIGAGAVAMGVGGLVGAAFAHGLVVVGMAYAYGELSGSHINPAVTLGLLVHGAIDMATAVGYWLAQLIGGILGAFTLQWLLSGSEFAGSLGNTLLAEGVSPAQGFVLEAILTFFLVNAVIQCAVRGRAKNNAGLAIGLTLAFCILMGGPLTGASLNPARTLGPAIASGNYADLWVYVAGTLVGAAAAALWDKAVFGED